MTVPRRDRGESLLEVLMAVVIIGIAFSAILAALGTAVRASGINRVQAEDTNYVRALAERLEALTPFDPCSTTAQYQTALAAVPAPTGAAVTVVSVGYWNGTAFGATCSSSTSLHRVAIRTTTPDARADSGPVLEVLRRRP